MTSLCIIYVSLISTTCNFSDLSLMFHMITRTQINSYKCVGLSDTYNWTRLHFTVLFISRKSVSYITHLTHDRTLGWEPSFTSDNRHFQLPRVQLPLRQDILKCFIVHWITVVFHCLKIHNVLYSMYNLKETTEIIQ